MKLLHVSDLHFHRAQFDWIMAACEQADLLCITGDFLDDRLEQSVTIQEQIAWIGQWAEKLPVPLLVCSGNHDLVGEPGSVSWLQALPGVYADNAIATFAGISLGCVPYGTSNFEVYARCDVLLHHEPPAGLNVAIQAGQDFGSPDLKLALKHGALAARWILCGHVHRPVKKLSKYRQHFISNPGANRRHPMPDHHWITI
ncbi:metallophosphoesterase [Shewanella sp. AS16]|uniref:metallophosphoesterase family protein n=1 Tax=Shewanella sp. AS16 TaxID=2907625 RepID=UPI002277514D|nr:metallophosphoesterase [Shewanella sp. AS16]MCE9685707.1 metallophosphoesterase [Shewanella sp. AS16]